MKRAIQWTRGERIAGWSVMAFVFFLALLTLWTSLNESDPPLLESGSNLVLPLRQLKPGKLLLFRYPISSRTIASVAVQRGSDGIIRVAFAACRSCTRSHNYEWSGKLV